MKKKLLTLSEYNSLRSKRRWVKIPKAERKKFMSELAKKRWGKRKKLSTDNDLQASTHNDSM